MKSQRNAVSESKSNTDIESKIYIHGQMETQRLRDGNTKTQEG